MRLTTQRENAKRLSFFGLVGLCVCLSICLFNEAFAQENQLNENQALSRNTETPMSGQEQIRWVKEQIASAEAVLAEVQGLLDRARQDKDAIKITCLDDKFTQMNVSLQGAKERLELLRDSVASGDDVAKDQQFMILKTYFSKMDGLASESENCLGEADVVLGKTRTAMVISGEMTAEDPADEDITDNLGLEQPTHMSAYY
jgi:hypothetical protein